MAIDRWEENDGQSTKRRFWCGYMALLVACIVVTAIMAFFSLVSVRGEGAAADQPLCQAVLNAQWPASIEGVDWVGYPQKWRDVPLSTFDQEPLLLPLGPAWEDGAYALYRLEDSIFIVPMYTLLQDTPDMHTVCPDVVRWYP